MKKIFALLIAVMMIATMSTVAFAGEVNYVTGGTIDVSGTFEAAADAAPVISADIEWTAMEFTYTEGTIGVWDPTSHSYINGTEGSWDGEGTITVTNHSNVDVTVGFSFDSEYGVTGEFTADTLELDAAEVGTARDEADSDSTTFSIVDGVITTDVTVLGTITVTIAEA